MVRRVKLVLRVKEVSQGKKVKLVPRVKRV